LGGDFLKFTGINSWLVCRDSYVAI